MVVYKIPYRRARAWPNGFRPCARASKGILHTKVMVELTDLMCFEPK